MRTCCVLLSLPSLFPFCASCASTSFVLSSLYSHASPPATCASFLLRNYHIFLLLFFLSFSLASVLCCVFRCRLDYSQVDAFFNSLPRSLSKASCLSADGCLEASLSAASSTSASSSFLMQRDREGEEARLRNQLRNVPMCSSDWISLDNLLLWQLLICDTPPPLSLLPCTGRRVYNEFRHSPSFVGSSQGSNNSESPSFQEERQRERKAPRGSGRALMGDQEWRQRRDDLSGVLQSEAQRFGIPGEFVSRLPSVLLCRSVLACSDAGKH